MLKRLIFVTFPFFYPDIAADIAAYSQDGGAGYRDDAFYPPDGGAGYGASVPLDDEADYSDMDEFDETTHFYPVSKDCTCCQGLKLGCNICRGPCRFC